LSQCNHWFISISSLLMSYILIIYHLFTLAVPHILSIILSTINITWTSNLRRRPSRTTKNYSHYSLHAMSPYSTNIMSNPPPSRNMTPTNSISIYSSPLHSLFPHSSTAPLMSLLELTWISLSIIRRTHSYYFHYMMSLSSHSRLLLSSYPLSHCLDKH